MKNRLLDGPGRTLECIHPKFIVDLIQSIDAPRQAKIVPQQQLFRERLTQEIMSQTQLRPWAMSGMYSENDALRLGLVEKLASMFDPGQLALTRITERLTVLQQNVERRAVPSESLEKQYEDLREHFSRRAAWKTKALTQRGLMVQAGLHSEQIFTRWRAGQYNGWSLVGRCFVALEELRWGAFGDACRLTNPEVSKLLKDNLRVMAADFLAQGIGASPATRHFYHQWMSTPTSPGLMDYKDLLGWMGDWCDAERHPVSWSVTQSWQTVALGMPRLCSATRLADALVEEIFSEGM
jgi:hypothetical protein